MSFTIRPAVREKVGLLFGLAGASGSGKTLTALLLASSIATDKDVIGFIDTEAEMVTIVLVGEKRGDALIVRGEVFGEHHEDHSSE